MLRNVEQEEGLLHCYELHSSCPLCFRIQIKCKKKNFFEEQYMISDYLNVKMRIFEVNINEFRI